MSSIQEVCMRVKCTEEDYIAQNVKLAIRLMKPFYIATEYHIGLNPLMKT